ncbi:hypothetical protein DXG01_004665, partial [Tephrocybe rancida]
LKKLAAHNYEDLLQCIIPVFDGLLSDEEPSHLNRCILRLLFHLAYWHSLAKLRLHSSAMLDLLDQQTTAVGDCLRDFQTDICASFSTRKLRQEAVARERRIATKAGVGKGKKTLSSLRESGVVTATNAFAEPSTTGATGWQQPSAQALQPPQPSAQAAPLAVPHTMLGSQVPSSIPIGVTAFTGTAGADVRGVQASAAHEPPITSVSTKETPLHVPLFDQPQDKIKQPSARRKEKKFSLSTYKFHSMGDYTSTIRYFGTTDSYSTEIVSFQNHQHDHHAMLTSLLPSLGQTGASSSKEQLQMNVKETYPAAVGTNRAPASSIGPH